MQLFNNTYTFWAILIIANIAMYGLTILISYSWSKIKQHKTLELTKKDVHNSILVLIINILVAIPGYLLFRNDMITFTTEAHFIRDFILLFIVFDLAMYVLHLASHHVWPFKKFHVKHHTHQYFNAISLYVMEPVESVLFGLLLTVCAYLFTLNLYSFLAFLLVNWLLGVVGHLNTRSTKQPQFFGNHVFHKTHHQHPNNNYGFYTVIWDKLFGTINK
jgi:sterol desaturase/sphingolipid hydroxylase (fatty acid hydroxylase superfamily)